MEEKVLLVRLLARGCEPSVRDSVAKTKTRKKKVVHFSQGKAGAIKLRNRQL
jgi:hypothetical protein